MLQKERKTQDVKKNNNEWESVADTENKKHQVRFCLGRFAIFHLRIRETGTKKDHVSIKKQRTVSIFNLLNNHCSFYLNLCK